MLNIIIEGPDKAGKGHLIALIGHTLRQYGLDVSIQSESTHNAPKIAKTDDELVSRLKSTKITIKEMQTFS